MCGECYVILFRCSCNQLVESLSRSACHNSSHVRGFGERLLLAFNAVDDLSSKKTIFQIGLPPLRIDIITAIDGVEFEDAWPDRVETSFGGVPALVISRHHLIANKKSSARLQDLADVQPLEESCST